jgi:hypothetical protein
VSTTRTELHLTEAVTMLQRVPVSFTLDGGMYAGIEQRAKTMGKKPADYVRSLCEAAYAARVGREKNTPAGDHELDQAVRAVFCLAGEFSTATIAKATGFSENLVRDILAGFKIVNRPDLAAERPKALPAPDRPPAAVDKTVRASDRAEVRSVFTLDQQALIASMWSEGHKAAAIGAAVNADADQIRAFAQAHRDLCEARPTTGDKGIKKAGKSPARSAEEIGTIKTMWAQGDSVKAIAAATGRPLPATYSWITTHPGICPKRRAP